MIYLVLYILFAPYHRQNDGITPPLHAPPQWNLLYIVYSPTTEIFGWLSCDYLLIGGQFSLLFYLFISFALVHLTSKTMGRHPLTHSKHHAPPLSSYICLPRFPWVRMGYQIGETLFP